MKILLDATGFEGHNPGIARSTSYLYEACLRDGRVESVAAFHDFSLVHTLTPGVQHFTPPRFLPFRMARKVHVPVALRRFRPDVVHFPNNGQVYSIFRGQAVVSTYHDVIPIEMDWCFDSEESEKRYRDRVQRDIDLSDVLITCSEHSKRQIVSNFRVKSEPVVIYHGVSVPNVPQCAGPAHADYFLFVCGYNPRKGLLPLLQVYLDLFAQGTIRAQLHITGRPDYYCVELAYAVKKGKEMGAVVERGYVSDTELPELFANARALLYPSYYEGFGLPPLEAMALGCPVLAQKRTSIPEVCGDCAVYVDVSSAADVSAALIALDTDADLRIRLREAGIQRSKLFRWECAANLFLSSLEEAVARRRINEREGR